MGYYIKMIDTQFTIFAEKKAAALTAVRALKGTYAWVDDDFARRGTLKETLQGWRYAIDEDKDGNVIGIEFTGQSLGDDETLFRALAPFVEAGSYLEVSGEEGAQWRWTFDGDKMSS